MPVVSAAFERFAPPFNATHPIVMYFKEIILSEIIMMDNAYQLIFDITTANVEKTEEIGAFLAKKIIEDGSNLPHFLALFGDLGVGKTALTRGIASVISPNAAVRSPTFALVNQYKSPIMNFYHFDMYRILSDDDLYSIGFYDYLAECEDGLALCVSEWCENIPFALPNRYIKITISKSDAGENVRKITAELIENNN